MFKLGGAEIRIGLRVVVPALVVLLGTIAIVLVSISEMAGEVNRIEETNLERSVESAVVTSQRRLRETNEDYARWDDAVRRLYGEPDRDFIEENFIASTETGKLFDTAYLLDSDGRDLFALRKGQPVTVSSAEAFGKGLVRLRAGLPSDGHRYDVRSGLVTGAFGVMEVAVGPVVPSSADFANTPDKSRFLVIARSFDAAAISRLGEDYVVNGLHFVASPAAATIPLTDPTGRTIGGLAWSPNRFGSQAHAWISPAVVVVLLLLSVTMIFLIITTLRGIWEVRRGEARARYQASHDSLSGLPNRPALIEAIERAIGRFRSDRTEAALVYADLDGFKLVNDAYGHSAGDSLLRRVAADLQKLCGERVIARVGGDEFVVLVEDPSAYVLAQALGDTLTRSLSDPMTIESHVVHVNASIGIAAVDNTVASAEELLRRADVAMYEAKQYGGSRVFVYKPQIDLVRHERLAMAEDLRAALAAGELELFYQPVFDVAGSRVVSAEALIRWERKGHGQVPPSAFVPVAEETGLMDELGAWALRQACRDARAWPGICLGVNVSPAQFRNPDFARFVATTLDQFGFPPERLQLEITETYLVSNPGEARRAMEAVRALGVSVALDDFGTGYSSIGYLRRFKFDKLKLDRSLIAGIVTDERVRKLVQATVALGHALNLVVTAEGVESENEAMLLRLAGCSEFQGFYFGEPCAAGEFVERHFGPETRSPARASA